MAIKVPVGETDFGTIRKNGWYYVDKTKLLAGMLDSADKVTLITRPRRFGKSLMLSTLEEFFNICNDKEDTRRLFEGLAIMEREDLVDEYMAKYPVLHFSFNGIEGKSFEELMDRILFAMQNWCKTCKPMLDFDKCDEDDVELFKRIKKGLANKQYDDSDKGKRLKNADMESFLVTMIRMLFNTHGEKVVVLLDEYDVPLAKASVLDDMVQVKKDKCISAYDAMKGFIAGLFGSALKDNDDLLERAVITGCLRIAQASIFTGTNHFSWYDIQRAGYADAFGFTPEEVERLLVDAGMPERMKDFKEWYDGYVFGKEEIYCPWDVLEQVKHLQENPKAPMEPHWLGTSENEVLRQMLRNPKMNIERQVSGLLAGGSVVATISKNVTYDILDSNKDNLWTILYQTGYLTKKDPDEDSDDLELVIPNKEVRKAYEKEIIEWMVDRSDTSHPDKVIEALLAHDAGKAASPLSQHLLESMSYFNYDEDFYHGFIGAYLKRGAYTVELDKEYGLGRPDILLRGDTYEQAVIIEVKHAKEEKDYAPKLKEAVDQCIREKYIEGAKTKFQNVVCYGLACYQKECMMQEVTENDTLPKPRAKKRRTTRKANNT